MSYDFGAQFGGAWSSIRVLGKGSFGEARLCQNARGDKAAVKLVNVGAMKAEDRKAAQMEVSLMAQLSHPNIVRYFANFEKDGVLHILLEYADRVRMPTIYMDNIIIRGSVMSFGDVYIFQYWKLTNQPAILLGMDVLGVLEQLIIDYRGRQVHIKTR